MLSGRIDSEPECIVPQVLISRKAGGIILHERASLLRDGCRIPDKIRAIAGIFKIPDRVFVCRIIPLKASAIPGRRKIFSVPDQIEAAVFCGLRMEDRRILVRDNGAFLICYRRAVQAPAAVDDGCDRLSGRRVAEQDMVPVRDGICRRISTQKDITAAIAMPVVIFIDMSRCRYGHCMDIAADRTDLMHGAGLRTASAVSAFRAPSVITALPCRRLYARRDIPSEQFPGKLRIINEYIAVSLHLLGQVIAHHFPGIDRIVPAPGKECVQVGDHASAVIVIVIGITRRQF